MSFFDEDDSTPVGYQRRRSYEGRRARRRRYGFWVLVIIAFTAFVLGALMGAATH